MFWIVGAVVFAGIMVWAVAESHVTTQHIREEEEVQIQEHDAVFDIRDLLKDKPHAASLPAVPKSLYHTK